MAVGVLTVELRLFSPHSLKEKRAILKPLKEFLRKKHNLSVAEIDNHDVWQSATLEIARASNDRSRLHGDLEAVSALLESRYPVTITAERLEIL